jgi:hypothetical protein
MLHVACCTLHAARFVLHAARCMLRVACCALHAACCALHAAYCALALPMFVDSVLSLWFVVGFGCWFIWFRENYINYINELFVVLFLHPLW